MAPPKKTTARSAPARTAPGAARSTAKKAAAKKVSARKGAAKKGPAKKASEKAPKKPAARPKLDIDREVLEFIAAIDAYKKKHGRPFPSWSEVLHIVHDLGYRKTS